MLSVTANILLILWLPVFQLADHDSETVLFLQWVGWELDHLYQGFPVYPAV